MFDDLKDAVAKLSIARLQKRIDALKAHQEKLDKFTTQRGLSELEHYRMSLSICTTIFVLFGLLVLIGTSMALMVKLVKNTPFEILMSALILAMFFLTIIGIFEGHVGKAIKYWQAASPINRAEMQKRIEALERALTESMAKRFKWDAKADEKV